MEELEKDQDALLASMAEAVPEALDNLTPKEKNEVYRRLRLEVPPNPHGYEVRSALGPSFVH